MLLKKCSVFLTIEYAAQNLKLSFPPRMGQLHLYQYTLLLTCQMRVLFNAFETCFLQCLTYILWFYS